MAYKNIANLNENGPFTVVDLGSGRFALLTTDNPSGQSGSEQGSDTFVTGTQNTVADNAVIAAPPTGYRTVIDAITIQNETSTAQTILLKSGANTIWRVRAPNDGDGIAFSNIRWLIAPATAVNLRPSAAANVGYSIAYHTEPV